MQVQFDGVASGEVPGSDQVVGGAAWFGVEERSLLAACPCVPSQRPL